MRPLDNQGAFNPLRPLREELGHTIDTLQNKRFVSKSDLSELDTKVQQLFANCVLMQEHDYLKQEDISSLQTLINRIQSVIYKGPVRDLFYKDSKTALTLTINTEYQRISSASSSNRVLTPAIWAGMLTKQNREEEAIVTALSIKDLVQKRQAFIEIIKNGGIAYITQEISHMGFNEIQDLFTALHQEKPNSFVKTMILSLPVLVASKEGIDAGLTLALASTDSAFKQQACANLVRAGGLAARTDFLCT